ncbi:MAG: hypothetical protein H6840_08420 [Planctomycetes bacterium]|nr:hypothetical protein [Planctomycetota bacterium]
MKLCRILLLLVIPLLPAGLGVRADDASHGATQARQFSQDEIDAAWRVLDPLPAERIVLLNNLRHLMRPSYEVELLQGRAWRPCPLPPFEQPGSGPLPVPEQLRLWAVLASGLPGTDVTRRQLERFFESDLPGVADDLGQFAVQLGVCRAALKHGNLAPENELRERARKVLDSAMKVRRGTDADSPLICDGTIQPLWFANHAWRSVMCRMAIELGLKFNEHVWETALRNMCAVSYKSRGWTSRGRASEGAAEDLDTNLLAIAAFDLAQTAPEDALGKGVQRTMEKDARFLPDILARLEREYLSEPLSGARFALLRTLAPELTPSSREARAWRLAVMQAVVEEHGCSGAVDNGQRLAGELGVLSHRLTGATRRMVDTAMNCLALSGGLLGDAAPLAAMSLPEIGQAMHALSVLHADALPEGAQQSGAEVEGVDEAIRRGCEYLKGIQLADGSFPGNYANYPANAAIAMLAMMHGGMERDAEPIKQGMEWLLNAKDRKGNAKASVWGGSWSVTYSDSIVLMMFQKYYEAEQRNSGILWADTPAQFQAAARKTWEAIDKRHREAILELAERIGATGGNDAGSGWGYSGAHSGGRRGGHWDNSNSQFAVLGYKAASSLGAPVKSGVAEREARRLLNSYDPDTSLPELEFRLHENVPGKTSANEWKGKIHPGGWGYNGDYAQTNTGMTAAGISSLAICRDELKVRGELKQDLERKIALTIHGAQAWLAGNYFQYDARAGAFRRDTPYVWAEYEFLETAWDGVGLFYDLYSVERAGVLAGISLLNGHTDWYEVGAEGLVQTQRAAGDWNGRVNEKDGDVPQIINTAMAILFLKKAAPPVISDPRVREPRTPPGPVTGEPKQKPRNPATGGPNGKKKQAGESEPTDKPKGPTTPGPGEKEKG